jgi:hypothetical protein
VEKTGITPTIKGKERVWWLGEMSRAGARDSSLFFLGIWISFDISALAFEIKGPMFPNGSPFLEGK